MPLPRRLAYLSLFLAYAQIVFGAIVRITDSGMGCGDHWPKCNGLWLPPLENSELVIEITHRWIAAALLVATLALVTVAYAQRHRPGIGGRGGVLRLASVAAALWIAPAVLGAVTVWLELPPTVVVAHLALAMALLGVLALTVIRAGGFGGMQLGHGTPRAARSAVAAAALAFVVVIMGGFTANLPGAAPACQGFPLCNGRLITEGTAQTIHWTHRLLAFVLTLHVVGMAVTARRQHGDAARRATMVLLGMIAVQIVLAAILVSTDLPKVLQSAHQAVGTLVWLAAMVVAGLAAQGAKSAGGANTLLSALSAPSAPGALSAP